MSQLRIISRSGEAFKDRNEAGKLLAFALDKYRDQNAVVLGIPRGGVVIAHEIAKALHADMDIVLAHKLGAPGYPELAIGSITETGNLFLNEHLIRELDISGAYIQREKAFQLAEIQRRATLYRQGNPKISLAGSIVIVTDDGLATGATTQAALQEVRLEKPEKLIAAFPVGPKDTIVQLAGYTEEVVCLRAPFQFRAVGQFYIHFDPVEDDEVIEIMRRYKTHHQLAE
ncbi:MAG: phosphoribosyltransferase [Dehalococcoidia bacterium]|nr:phosphoribosyltransferase [Dehalococcoidia bacterium]